MNYKTPELKAQVEQAYYKLAWVLEWLDKYLKEHYGTEATITCVRRTRQETLAAYAGAVNPLTKKPYEPDEVPHSVHESEPCRGADVRSRNFTDEQCKAIEAAVNKAWQYDPVREGRKVCIWHDVAGAHFHIQVHTRTVRVA